MMILEQRGWDEGGGGEGKEDKGREVEGVGGEGGGGKRGLGSSQTQNCRSLSVTTNGAEDLIQRKTPNTQNWATEWDYYAVNYS